MIPLFFPTYLTMSRNEPLLLSLEKFPMADRICLSKYQLIVLSDSVNLRAKPSESTAMNNWHQIFPKSGKHSESS